MFKAGIRGLLGLLLLSVTPDASRHVPTRDPWAFRSFPKAGYVLLYVCCFMLHVGHGAYIGGRCPFRAIRTLHAFSVGEDAGKLAPPTPLFSFVWRGPGGVCRRRDVPGHAPSLLHFHRVPFFPFR